MLPKVGQTVLVTLGSNYKKGTGFNGRLTTKKRIVQKITKVYDGGNVATTSGDIWDVKVLPTAAADFVTIEPAQE